MRMQQEVVETSTSEGVAPEPHIALRMEIARTGVRQFLIAKRLGISEGHLSRILSGRKALTDDVVAQIQAAIVELSA